DRRKLNLPLAMDLLDKQYLSGRAVEVELRRELKRLPAVTEKSPEHHWLQFQSAVSKLLLRVNSGNLNATAERDMYHIFFEKLADADQRDVAKQGPGLQDLATQVEQFVNRARVYEESKNRFGGTSSRASHQSDPDRERRPSGLE